MSENGRTATEIWNNEVIPVILRWEVGKPVRLRIPAVPDAQEWLKNGARKRDPVWIDAPGKKYWELPHSRFSELVALILDRFGKIYIFQPLREKEICAPSCMSAKHFVCECSCMGKNHGRDTRAGWYEVSDAFAVRHEERKLAIRLLDREGGRKTVGTFAIKPADRSIPQNIYQMYIANGNRVGFFIRSAARPSTYAKVISIAGKTEGPLIGCGPFYGNPVVNIDVFDFSGTIQKRNITLSRPGTFLYTRFGTESPKNTK